jgi:outer membrane receptor protein involved in Fe transport
MKHSLGLWVTLLAVNVAFAQSPAKVSIKGTVVDTSNLPAPYPTVMLLNPADSSLLNFTRADEKGNFEFKNIRNIPYLLKISLLSYQPRQIFVAAHDKEVNDLGNVQIKPITLELMEVVIKTAKATLSIRGDTIEYDASTFKVPPGSTVEDLLRRLPGIDVDADGNIKSQGRDVRKVYVDGKTFFGDDPKAATKNLGAETISKVQVFNEKSEQAKITGVDDGKKDKVMNLELKAEYKKGAFGKITGALGDQERWAARGNFNRFNTKEQFSLIGFGNNINQTGVNWEDYGEFKGQNAYNDFDSGDFGFNSGGGRVFYFGGDGNGIQNRFDGRGFTKNFGGGANYNFDSGKKTKFNASYTYNQTDLSLDEFSFRQTFLPDTTFFNSDTLGRGEFRNNHILNSRLESNLDSNNVLIVKANARISNQDFTNLQSQFFSNSLEKANNRLSVDNNSNRDTWALTSTLIFRHRFKKKGRAFAYSAAFNQNQNDLDENFSSLNRFFTANTFTDQVRQLNRDNNGNDEFKSSLLYTDALSKKWYWESFYNFSQATAENQRRATDPELNNQLIENLSLFSDNKLLYNRLGSSIRYSHEGINFSFGLAALQYNLHGEFARDEDLPLVAPALDRTFRHLTPNINLSMELPNNIWISSDYSYGVNAPRFNDLRPVTTFNNPAFRSEGNPNLNPELSHNLSLGFNYWDPASFSSMNFNLDYRIKESQIVYNQVIEPDDKLGILSITRPENVSGGRELNSYFWMNRPIIKTKLTASLNGGINYSKNPAFVNGVENETTSQGGNINLDLSATPNAKLIFSVGGSLNFNNISYSIQEEQNQKIRNSGIDANLKYQFAKKTFLETNLDYNIYRNDRFDFKQDIPIWNASIRRIIGKNNKIEMRLAGFDILNKRLTINQNGSANFVERRISNTLARYFMLSLSYNVRGYESKLKKNNWW